MRLALKTLLQHSAMGLDDLCFHFYVAPYSMGRNCNLSSWLLCAFLIRQWYVLTGVLNENTITWPKAYEVIIICVGEVGDSLSFGWDNSFEGKGKHLSFFRSTNDQLHCPSLSTKIHWTAKKSTRVSARKMDILKLKLSRHYHGRC